MFEGPLDTSSINCYLSSYHKLTKTVKHSLNDKLQLPALNAHFFIKANLNTKQLKIHVTEREEKLTMPIFTFNVWSKLKIELKAFLKKMFHIRLKEINEGALIVLQPGQSINIRADCFCLAPHVVYTILIPLEKCDMQSATIAVSEPKLTWQAENQYELFDKMQEREFQWHYCQLQEGDVVIIGRDCIYGSFRYTDVRYRNDSKDVRHFVEMRWVRYDHSSSSSNSSS